MLSVLCLALLCSLVGAQQYQRLPFEDIKEIMDELQNASPDGVFYTGVPVATEVDTSTVFWPESSHLFSSEEPEDEFYSTESTYDVTQHEPEENSEDRENANQPYVDDLQYEFLDRVGSIRGIPGINFPDYANIPVTTFQCSDKDYVPGFYADMETGCQVFHVCWPDRRESFLCPVGTTFNQAILACDYWYSSNCSLADHYYDVNAESSRVAVNLKKEASVGSMIDSLLDTSNQHPADTDDSSYDAAQPRPVDLSYLMKFLPVKAKVVAYPETGKHRSKIVAEASIGKTRKGQKPTEKPVYTEIEPEYTPVSVEARPVLVRAPRTASHHLKSKPSEYPGVDKIVYALVGMLKSFLLGYEGVIPGLENIEVTRKVKPVYAEPEYTSVTVEATPIPIHPPHTASPHLKSKPLDGFETFVYSIFDNLKSFLKDFEGIIPAFKNIEVTRKVKPMYPGIKPEYKPVTAEATPVPIHPPHTTSSHLKSKPSEEYPGLDEVVYLLFDKLKSFMKDFEGVIPELENIEITWKGEPLGKKHIVVEKPIPTRKVPEVKPKVHLNPLPLTQLNPRFITKPIQVKQKLNLQVPVRSTPKPRFYVPRPVTKIYSQ